MVEKKQKGGFLPILGALTRALLVSAAGAVGEEVLIELGKKIGGGGGRWEKKKILKKMKGKKG